MRALYDTLVKCPTNISWIWRVIRQVLATFQTQMFHSLRNGKNTRIWFDIWLKPKPLTLYVDEYSTTIALATKVNNIINIHNGISQ